MITRTAKRFLASSLVVLALFIGAGATVYRSTLHLLEVSRFTLEPEEVLIKLRGVTYILDDSVSTTRNYILTGNLNSLGRLSVDKTILADLMKQVHPLLSNNPTLDQLGRQLEHSLTLTIHNWEGAVTSKPEGNSTLADGVMDSPESLQVLRDDSQLIDEMSD